jgi:hypothetical protein
MDQGRYAPEFPNHSLYHIELFKLCYIKCCYPEGNFGWNQLPDGSISLSPLNSVFDHRFARQNGFEPPSEFPLTSP